MKKAASYKEKLKELLRVMLPVFITQVALTSTGFFDTVMTGHFSEQDLAGVAVGFNLFFPFFGGCLGIISGLTPVVAHYHGAGSRRQIVYVMRQGFYWSLALAGLLVGMGFLFVPPFLSYLSLEDRVAYVVQYYLLALSAGIIPIFLSGVLRNFIDALGATRITMCITVLTVPVNICLNYVFIYGAFGLPACGGIGAGIGTAVSFYLNLLLNLLVVSRMQPFKGYGLFQKLLPPSFAAWKRQLSVGIPIGCTMFCEQSIFGAVGLFMTAYGTTVVAAHQAAINFTTLVYMLPLSVSMSMTILVGYEAGAGRIADARQYGRLGRLVSLGMIAVLALLCVFFRSEVSALYTNDAAVGDMLQVFLCYAVAMQTADSIDAPLQGILRGYKDVRAAFVLAVVSYWVIGLPGGWLLAHRFGFGPYGYWLGLIGGIFSGAVFLCFRLYRMEARFFRQS